MSPKQNALVIEEYLSYLSLRNAILNIITKIVGALVDLFIFHCSLISFIVLYLYLNKNKVNPEYELYKENRVSLVFWFVNADFLTDIPDRCALVQHKINFRLVEI